jgi:ketosteroid isomerase-like protein
VVAREHPAATTHRGAEAIRGYLADWRTMMPGLRIEVDELLERGDYILVVGRIEGAGAGSGAAAEVPIATLSTFRDGATSRVEEFLDPAEARAEFERRSGEPA